LTALAVLNGLSTFVKVGWIVWLLWCAAQILWYQLARAARSSGTPARRSGFGLGLSHTGFDSAEVAKASRGR
jgi:hypothetical protein